MRNVCFLIVFLLITKVGSAQDTLWVHYSRNDIPFIMVKAKNGESIYDMAKYYSVPPGFLSDLNGISLQQQLSTGTTIKVPIGSYNYRRVNDPTSNRPLFYKVQEGNNLQELAKTFNTSLSSLQQWNHLGSQNPGPGSILIVGWISYNKIEELQPPQKVITDSPARYNVIRPEEASLEELMADSMQSVMEASYFNDNNGRALDEESGAAVFFDSKAPAKPGVYYAFHNTAARGTIIKVYNPDGDKTAYVKVIGKIPELKEYHNCIIAISEKAAKALGAPYKRAFCKISY